MLLTKSILIILLLISLLFLIYILFDIYKFDNKITEVSKPIDKKEIENLIETNQKKYAYRCDLIGREDCPNHNITENKEKNCIKYYTNGCLFLFEDNTDKCEMSIDKCLDCKFSDINDFMSLGAFIYCKINGKRLNVYKCIKEA